MQDYSLDYTSQDYYYLGSEYGSVLQRLWLDMCRVIFLTRLTEGYCKAVIKGI